MLKTVEGVYRDGKIELGQILTKVRDEIPVLVTFLEPAPIDLRAWGIDETQAADLRARLTTFAEDWASPEMENYDYYDIAKNNL